MSKFLGHSRFWLAPLEGVSDFGFRNLCHTLGASLTFTEMIRGAAVIRENSATLDLIDTFDFPTGIQLMVKSADELKRCLDTIEKLGTNKRPHFKNICAIDINLGCPSPDVISLGAGPALLKRTTKLKEIFHALTVWKTTTSFTSVQAVGCKIRLGLNAIEQHHKIYLKVVDAANEANLDYMIVHARHAKQKSSDLPTWKAIGEIKALANPDMAIIGNGNIFRKEDADEMMSITGCDGYLLARAAITNPWIFRYLKDGINNDIINLWPSEEEIKAAKESYLQISRKHSTKEKYLNFNLNNFDRLMHCMSTNDIRLHTVTPKTMHL